MPAKQINLQFPLGGLHKAIGLQRQPPFTSPALSNVRPSDTYQGRDRGGSRPGLTKSLAAQLGSGNPVRSLSSVRWISSGAPATQGMAIANGLLYREYSNNWAAVGGLGFSTSAHLRPAQSTLTQWGTPGGPRAETPRTSLAAATACTAWGQAWSARGMCL